MITTYKSCNCCTCTSGSCGIKPVRLLYERYSDCRFVRRVRLLGMLPVSLFCDRSAD